MNCHDARRHWDLYHDSEGDAELHFQLNEHLENCAECAEWFHGQSRLESLIRERLNRVTKDDSPAVDWSKVLARAGVTPAKRSNVWSVFGSVLVALAAGILLMIGFVGGFSGDELPDLATLSAEVHDGVLAGSLHPDFESESDLDVDRYLVNHVPFSVRCPPRKDSGFVVRGAGLCKMADQSTAYVVGSVDRQPVSIFVLPQEILEKYPQQRDELRRAALTSYRKGQTEIAISIIDRNLVLVAGNVDQAKLTRVLNSYGTYPHSL